MKLKGLRWWIIGLVCLATVINYIDRAALGIMWPAMKDDLGLTEADYAWIINIFTIEYKIILAIFINNIRPTIRAFSYLSRKVAINVINLFINNV